MAALKINECKTSAETNGVEFPYVDPNGTYYNNLRPYHQNAGGFVERAKLFWEQVFQFGFECEKVDNIALGGAQTQKLYDMGYRLEADSSLGSNAGYELISPVYNLHYLKAFLADMVRPELKRMIDGDFTERCGGHMTLSAKGMTSREVFEGVIGFLPLIYALYPNRAANSYCVAKDKAILATNPDKYSSIYVRNSYIEFRIFPAIKSTKNLYWRVRLLRVMIENFGASEKQVIEMMLDKKSTLHKLLREIYTLKAIAAKAIKTKEMAKRWNRVNLIEKQIKGWKNVDTWTANANESAMLAEEAA